MIASVLKTKSFWVQGSLALMTVLLVFWGLFQADKFRAAHAEETPVYWTEEHDAFMKKAGWTISSDRQTIFKNGVKLFSNERKVPCKAACVTTQFFGPADVRQLLVDAEKTALEESEARNRADFFARIDMEDPRATSLR